MISEILKSAFYISFNFGIWIDRISSMVKSLKICLMQPILKKPCHCKKYVMTKDIGIELKNIFISILKQDSAMAFVKSVPKICYSCFTVFQN